MNYDELIKELRERADWINFPKMNEEYPVKEAKLMYDADDAIEELSKELERSKDFEAFWQHEAEEALKKLQVAISNKPRWIPVTERLPECQDEVLVVVCGEVGIAWLNPYEDKWESNDFGFSYIREHNPTHWMPLPEPPKEESE